MTHELIGIARCAQVVSAMHVADAAATLIFDRALHQRDIEVYTPGSQLCSWVVDIVHTTDWMQERKLKICFRFTNRTGEVDRVIFPMRIFNSEAIMYLIADQMKYPDNNLVQFWDLEEWKRNYQTSYPIADLVGDHHPDGHRDWRNNFPMKWWDKLHEVRKSNVFMYRLSDEAKLRIINNTQFQNT